MGLSIGVVKITYLREPPEPVYGFLDDLKIQALEGLEEPDWDDDEGEDEWVWGGGWGMNGLVEFSRNYLSRWAVQWGERCAIGPSDMEVVQGWIAALPWEDDLIMLHIGE